MKSPAPEQLLINTTDVCSSIDEPPSPTDTTEDLVSIEEVDELSVANCLKRKKKLHKTYLAFLENKTYYTKKFPWFILTISVVELLVFTTATDDIRRFLLYDPFNRHQIWRFITYMLLHNDILHVILNIAIQCLLATPLEIEQGHTRTGAVYIGGVLSGSLGASVLDPALYMVGASAGVYALLISHIPNILLNYHTCKYKLYRTLIVCLLAAADITFTCYHFYTVGNTEPRIGWAAHSTGAFSGFVLGLLLYKGTEEWSKTVHILSGAILLILTALAITHNALSPPVHLINAPT